MTSANLQRAMLLHCKPYRENSFIGDFLCEQSGRVSVFFRKSKKGASLSLFNLYLVSLKQGQNELFFVNSYELDKSFDNLHGHFLYSGMYVNELLSHLLPRVEFEHSLFELYQLTIANLVDIQQQAEAQAAISLAVLLRNFELSLIDELGLMPDFLHTADEQTKIDANQSYYFVADTGWVSKPVLQTPIVCSGQLIHKIAQRDFSNKDDLAQTKQLMRYWLDQLLGHKKLKSRALFIQPKK
ncbi:DNA repair protein RecO [Catenovulum sp. SX2]|uniref:DNA repair protein RecO n=1 Tax=Catenovulum sp. SX2 TaxID=3398614 RepID=UPI003F8415E1